VNFLFSSLAPGACLSMLAAWPRFVGPVRANFAGNGTGTGLPETIEAIESARKYHTDSDVGGGAHRMMRVVPCWTYLAPRLARRCSRLLSLTRGEGRADDWPRTKRRKL